ncbi:hypothetical protein F5Y15DRAFT_409374 [Xylariaceae sp. FL0016]|nr:hypothetical protein F5Y15DRAFT_409374 [Xylariaceae sp. FL0016]
MEVHSTGDQSANATNRDTGSSADHPPEESTGDTHRSSVHSQDDGGPPAVSYRASQFADKDFLSLWFPQITDDEKKSWRIWISRRSRALMLQIVLIIIILATNLGFTVFAITRYGSANGVGLIFSGPCQEVKTLDQYLHLLINLLGTGMLSASNYCMQLQAAPTRADVDRAHRAKGPRAGSMEEPGQSDWLDIGVPSLRNLKYISSWRKLAWLLLALSSMPIHLIFNSAVFQSLSSDDYTIAVVKDSFKNGSSWNLESAEQRRKGYDAWDVPDRVNPTEFNYTNIISEMQNAVMNGTYQYQNVSACFELYVDYFKPQSNAVIFVKNETVQSPVDDSLLIYVSVIPRSDDWPKNQWALANGTRDWIGRNPSHTVNTVYLGPEFYEMSYCLVEPPNSAATRCRLEYAPGIMFTVIMLNSVKAMTMLCVWGMRRWQAPKRDLPQNQVLYTLGDAIASFMHRPDATTKDMGLATRRDFLAKRTWKNHWVKEEPKPSREPRPFQVSRIRWIRTASVRRWIVLIVACTLVILVASILIGVFTKPLKLRKVPTTLTQYWELGFGALTPYTYLVVGFPTGDPEGLIYSVPLANLPQLILSFIYILYNTMLSTFLVQREFSRMYNVRKPLRVSEPDGIQRSSYFISLPLRYGIPLYASSGLLHWLVSQSLFLARITALAPDGTVDTRNSFSTCGYSPIAVFITVLVGVCMVVIIVLLGLFRTYDGHMRLVATNSRAISAACHVLREDIADGHLLPVQWGLVEVTDGVGKCAFTTAAHVHQPTEGHRYV